MKKSISLEELTEPLFAYFDDSVIARLPGWQIKEAAEPHAPVGVVAEPQGGLRVDAEGRSLRSAAYARLFVASPKLLQLAIAIDQAYSHSGELNTLTSEHGTYELKKLAVAALAEVRGKKRRKAATS